MQKELTITPIKGQQENYYKGECQCSYFNVYLPSVEAVERMHLDHLYLVHAEYALEGIEKYWIARGGKQ